ncbi:MAG: hypothetical protein HFJ20_03110 [Clostridia bacterium]|nr:hypothetical protein [Clostridia bacterium]
MGYKMNKVGKNFRKNLIIFIIVWCILTILFVAPISLAIKQATANGVFDMPIFIENVVPAISSFNSIFRALSAEYIGTFFNTSLFFTAGFAIVVVIGLAKSAPKNEYSDIEHGSSDWSENGEQYRILNKNKGIILAQKNYLPVGKRGNINVLVVGRFRFW